MSRPLRLTDSEHEDQQASDDELPLTEELRCLDMKEERLKREKNDRIVRLQELIEKKGRSVETLEESLTRMPHPDQFSESFDGPVRSEPVRTTNTGVRMTTKDLRRLTLKEELPQTPIDELLVDLNMDDDGRNVRFAAAGSYKEHSWKRNKIDIPSLIEAHQLNKDRRKIESSSRLFKNLPDPADVFLGEVENSEFSENSETSENQFSEVFNSEFCILHYTQNGKLGDENLGVLFQAFLPNSEFFQLRVFHFALYPKRKTRR